MVVQTAGREQERPAGTRLLTRAVGGKAVRFSVWGMGTGISVKRADLILIP